MTTVLGILARLWRDPRFRAMAYAVVTAIAGYLTAVITAGAPLPTP